MESPTTKVILYFIYAVVVAGLLTVIITSFHTSKVSAPTSKGQSAQSSKQGGQPSPSKVSQSQANQSQASNSNNQSAANSSAAQPSTSQTANTGTSTNGQLSNTGPGDTIGLFAVATATGVIGYRVVVARKLKASNRL